MSRSRPRSDEHSPTRAAPAESYAHCRAAATVDGGSDFRSGNLRGATECWFIVEVPFWREPLPLGVMRLVDAARLLGRPRSAVAQAVRDGRIERAPRPPGCRGTAAYVQLPPGAVDLWRVRSAAEVLAQTPDLPQDLDGWRTISEVARVCRCSFQVASWRLEHAACPLLEWGKGTPFRRERRYYVPDLVGFRRRWRRRRAGNRA